MMQEFSHLLVILSHAFWYSLAKKAVLQMRFSSFCLMAPCMIFSDTLYLTSSRLPPINELHSTIEVL